MNRINQIWQQVESNPTDIPGLFRVRYLENTITDIFLGVKYPENYRALILRTPLESGKEINLKYELRGLKFEKVYDPNDPNHLLLNLLLLEENNKDIFNVLIHDIINSIINEKEINLILKTFINRLVKWQSIFERYKNEGLTPEQQRGLYGELYFLRKMISRLPDLQYCLKSWIGCSGENRDFEQGRWGIEVKTTHGNNQQKIHVSNERQLDIRNTDNLILYHISLDVRSGKGETLNKIVDEIGMLLKKDSVAYIIYRNKLIEAGYFDFQRVIYEEPGYFIRKDNYYCVEKDFPRIEESDIRDGVGDVSYSIVLTQCDKFIRTEDEVFNISIIR